MKQQLRFDFSLKSIATMLYQGKASLEELDRMQQILQEGVKGQLDDGPLLTLQDDHEDSSFYTKDNRQFQLKMKTTKHPVNSSPNLLNHPPQRQDPLSFLVKTTTSTFQREEDILQLQLRNHQKRQPLQTQQHLVLGTQQQHAVQ